MVTITYLCLLLPVLSHGVYVPGTPGASWSQDEIDIVKSKLRFTYRFGRIKEAQHVTGVGEVGDNGGGHNAAKVLRLSFHDCLKYVDGGGGCDGCLNWRGVGTLFNQAKQNLYPDVGPDSEGGNNGLRHTVEVLEAIYTVPRFPRGTPVLNTSLRDSGKSRADLWSLAAITAVEFSIDVNNEKCRDPSSHKGCLHLQGEPGCEVRLNNSIPFRTGRADCLSTNITRPYIASQEEVHPNAVGDGVETVEFFRDQFNFTGQETVAIMGAHTLGGMRFKTSLFRCFK